MPISVLCSGLCSFDLPVLRRFIDDSLQLADLSDTLPLPIRKRYDLVPFEQAITFLHHPPPNVSYAQLVEHEHPAWRRIKFDELLAQQLALAAARARRRAQRAQPLGPDKANLVQRLLDSLPFALTPGQARVQRAISTDPKRNFSTLSLRSSDRGRLQKT